jgi:hypothetical protein
VRCYGGGSPRVTAIRGRNGLVRGCICAEWWAHLVGALRVHPHKHYANYPHKSDRRNFEVGGYLQIYWPFRIVAWGRRSLARAGSLRKSLDVSGMVVRAGGRAESPSAGKSTPLAAKAGRGSDHQSLSSLHHVQWRGSGIPNLPGTADQELEPPKSAFVRSKRSSGRRLAARIWTLPGVQANDR